MAMPHNTKAHLQSEDIADPSGLLDLTKEAMAMISQNLRIPGGDRRS